MYMKTLLVTPFCFIETWRWRKYLHLCILYSVYVQLYLSFFEEFKSYCTSVHFGFTLSRIYTFYMHIYSNEKSASAQRVFTVLLRRKLSRRRIIGLLHTSPSLPPHAILPSPSASCLSFLVFLCVATRAFWRGGGSQIIRTARKSGPL
jgi:hypothetical protein